MTMQPRETRIPTDHVFVYVDCRDGDVARRVLRSLSGAWSDTTASLEVRFLARGAVRIGAWSRVPESIEEILRGTGATPHRNQAASSSASKSALASAAPTTSAA